MRRSWLWVGLLVAITGLSAYILRGFVRFYILVPIVYAARIEQIILNAIPQVAYWIVFLFMIFLLAAHSLLLKRAPRKVTPTLVEKWDSRARQFSQWFTSSRKSEYSKWMLARQISDLTINLLVYQERISADEVGSFIRRGKISMPPEVRNYLLAGLEVPSFRHYSEFINYWKLSNQASPLDLNPEMIIEFLESRVQIGGLE